MRRWLLFIVVVTLLVSAYGQDKKQDSFGIDVSHHNGNINWDQVSDVEFVYIKATEGERNQGDWSLIHSQTHNHV